MINDYITFILCIRVGDTHFCNNLIIYNINYIPNFKFLNL